MHQDIFLAAYETHKNTVYSVIFNYVRNPDDAKELHQEVFIKLFQCDSFFESNEHMKAWLIRVSSNLCKNFLRSRKHVSDEQLPEDIPVEMDYEDKTFWRVIYKLPLKYRMPIHLFYYEEYSTKEIAETLQVPEATVRVRLKRGREQLKKILEKEEWQ